MECVDVAVDQFPLSVGSLYVRKHFNEDAKKNLIDMVSDIKKEFIDILHKVSINIIFL